VAVLGAIIGDNIGFPVGHLGGWQLVERICTWAGLDYLADENIVEIYAAFERYKWYVIAAIALIATILITRRVRRTRLGRRLVRL
jgi:membrane protein DedA with SNARE-associated domain